MFRIMSIATLVLIAICFFIGASLAFADEGVVKARAGTEQTVDGSGTTQLKLAERDRDEYDFGDYTKAPSSVPAVDAETIEEPEIDRHTTIEI